MRMTFCSHIGTRQTALNLDISPCCVQLAPINFHLHIQHTDGDKSFNKMIRLWITMMLITMMRWIFNTTANGQEFDGVRGPLSNVHYFKSDTPNFGSLCFCRTHLIPECVTVWNIILRKFTGTHQISVCSQSVRWPQTEPLRPCTSACMYVCGWIAMWPGRCSSHRIGSNDTAGELPGWNYVSGFKWFLEEINGC